MRRRRRRSDDKRAAMARALAFPGQGSQRVGMGKALHDAFPAAREVFQEVDDALDLNLSRIVFQGPAETLTLTENAQPALMAASMAVVRVLRAEAGLEPAALAAFVAGHSLGEYSALAAAGSLRLADAARLLRRRGQAMQDAVPVGEGAMIAVLGLDLEDMRMIAAGAARDDICEIANDNAPGQTVLSGDAAAIGRAAEAAKARGARRVVPLPVSAPFHCRLLEPAADAMRDALEGVILAAPDPPVVANVTAAPVRDPNAIRCLLVEQVTAAVRWRESVLDMKRRGVDTLVEVGAGRVLSALARRIDRELTGLSLLEPREIEDFAATL